MTLPLVEVLLMRVSLVLIAVLLLVLSAVFGGGGGVGAPAVVDGSDGFMFYALIGIVSDVALSSVDGGGMGVGFLWC